MHTIEPSLTCGQSVDHGSAPRDCGEEKMKTNPRTTVAIAATLFVLLATTLPLAAQEPAQQDGKNRPRYQLIDLGTLGGPNGYLPALPPYHDFVPSASLSQAGTFAGFADTATLDPFSQCFNPDCFTSHAIAWRDGKMTDLGALPGQGSSSAATWISENGLIVGFSENGEIDPLVGAPVVLGVLWKNGEVI